MGFTLAEVLITLAIIGVVAALTIPTLIAENQQRGWNTASTVFERKLEESLKVMNTQGTLAGYKTTEDFVSELQKHLKITKVCKNDDILSCFEDKVYWGGGDATPEEVDMSKVKTSKHFGKEDWGTNLVGIQLNNGTSAIVAYNPECKQDPYSNQITGSDCLAILYDTSGYAKPNTSGKDLRTNNNVTKLGSNCAFEIGNTCYTAAFQPEPLTLAECEAQKDDLGIKECYYDNDYWAGAVAQCGHVSKMPTQAQLVEIANYVYNTDQVQLYLYTTDLTLDYDKTSALGFTESYFYVWSGEEQNNRYAYSRFFTPTYTRYANGDDFDRFFSYVQAVCLE